MPALPCPWFIIKAYKLQAIELGKDLSIKNHLLEKVWVPSNIFKVLIDVPTIKVMADVLALVLNNDNMMLELEQHLDKQDKQDVNIYKQA